MYEQDSLSALDAITEAQRTPQHSVTRNLVSAHLALYGMELAS